MAQREVILRQLNRFIGREKYGVEITAQMVDECREVLGYVFDRLDENPGAKVLIEQKVAIDEDIWGTVDVIIVK